MYTQSGYRRASIKSGPGMALVQLADAEAAIGAWRTRAEMRSLAYDQGLQQRDSLVAVMRRAESELSQVDEHHEALPAEAAAALTNAIKALKRALVQL